MKVSPVLAGAVLVVVGFLLIIVVIGALDRHAEWQERQTYRALIAHIDSLTREVNLCQATTTRMGGRLTVLEQRRRPIRRASR